MGSEPAQVTVGIDDRDGLVISVADSGPGVPEHLREEIFARGVTSKPDVPGGRRALRGAIARSGAHGVGAEALSAARELRPHLILLDVYLPDMTGLEVLQRLRSEGDRVGVIMITAARELDTVSGALDGGAADYLIDTLFG